MHQKPQPWFRQTALKRKLTTFIHEKPVLLHAKAFDQKTPERLRKSRAIMQSNAVNTFSICAAQTREEPSMKIGIGNDHAAVELKNIISEHLKERGCVISLASSSIASRARTILDGNGVTDYFDYFTFGPEVENGKPAPDIFLKALSKTGAAPEESLVLEDSEAGIKAAVSAHIPVACVPDVARPSAETLEKAAGVFDSLLQVMEWIKAK